MQTLQYKELVHVFRAEPSSFPPLLSSLESSDTRVYEPSIRALLGTTSQLCEAVVLKLRRTESEAELDADSKVDLQGYLAYKKTHPPRTLPLAYV